MLNLEYKTSEIETLDARRNIRITVDGDLPATEDSRLRSMFPRNASARRICMIFLVQLCLMFSKARIGERLQHAACTTDWLASDANPVHAPLYLKPSSRAVHELYHKSLRVHHIQAWCV